MLGRLRHPAAVGRHDEEYGGGLADTPQHVWGRTPGPPDRDEEPPPPRAAGPPPARPPPGPRRRPPPPGRGQAAFSRGRPPPPRQAAGLPAPARCSAADLRASPAG